MRGAIVDRDDDEFRLTLFEPGRRTLESGIREGLEGTGDRQSRRRLASSSGLRSGSAG